MAQVKETAEAKDIPMAVRPATQEDVPVLVEIGYLEYKEELAFVLGLDFSHLSVQAGFARLVMNQGTVGSCLVAEVYGKIVGFYSCRYEPSMLAYGQRICVESGWYVHPGFRGQGIGKALLKATTKMAYENGCRMKKVALAITTEAGRSLMEWYERMGYMPFEAVAFKQLTEEDFQ